MELHTEPFFKATSLPSDQRWPSAVQRGSLSASHTLFSHTTVHVMVEKLQWKTETVDHYFVPVAMTP